MSPPIIIKVFERDVDNSLLNELEKLERNKFRWNWLESKVDAKVCFQYLDIYKMHKCFHALLLWPVNFPYSFILK